MLFKKLVEYPETMDYKGRIYSFQYTKEGKWAVYKLYSRAIFNWRNPLTWLPLWRRET